MAKKKRRVPEVLWRLFRNRARTLLETLASLIPHSGENENDAVSFLLKKDDPSDYRKLLTRSYVVVSENAPHFQASFTERRWSQIQIVRKTIEGILREGSMYSNVLGSGYDKSISSSPIVELLSCSSWVHLLNRVGDDVMVHLLKYTSIFLPLPHEKHHQISGPPINQLCQKFPLQKSTSEDQHSLFFPHGSREKRKRTREVNSPSKRCWVIGISDCDSPGVSGGCFGCQALSGSCMWPSGRKCRKKCQQMSSCEALMPSTRSSDDISKGCTNGMLQVNQTHAIVEPKKRARQFSWQRRRKRIQFNSQENSSLRHCANINFNKVNSSGMPGHCGSNASLSGNCYQKILPLCSCCLLLQGPQEVSERTHINRQSIFYKLEFSRSIFPKNHVLNSLKPNFHGSSHLFKEILGLSAVSTSPRLESCCHRDNSCLIGHACLYHSLSKTLKSLIRRAQCCQHLRLLDKHCAVPFFNQNITQDESSESEGNPTVMNPCRKDCVDIQMEGSLQVKKSRGSVSTHCKKKSKPVDGTVAPFNTYCLKSQVVSFIWAACRSIVPEELLGTIANWRILRRNIAKFIRLRRYEKFSLRQCMHRLKTSRFSLLLNKHNSCYYSNHVRGDPIGQNKKRNTLDDSSHSVKKELLKHWIFWFFSSIVVPLVQSNFYVTESEHGKQDVFYYRKPSWEKITERAVTCLKDQSFFHLDDASVRNVIRKRSFGFSKVRLCPKENGVRVLANLRAPSRMPSQIFSSNDQHRNRKAQSHIKGVKFDHFKSVNYILRDLHAVLKGLQLKEPEKLGSSVFDYNDVYRKLCPFLTGLKNGSAIMPCAYIVVADVAKAFDSVDQDKLLSVMKDVIVQDNYLLKKSSQVICTKKSLWVHENLMSADQSSACSSTKFRSAFLFRSLHSILVNQEWSRSISKENLYSNLTEHLKRNVLQLYKKFYLQAIGIPQGSILSALLCSFYYGHLEKIVIYPFLEKAYQPDPEHASGSSKGHKYYASGHCRGQNDISQSPKYILLRFIDDFLFISTLKKQAASFFSRLQRGFREYNCYMNKDKFCLNFDTDEKLGSPSNRMQLGEDGVSYLRWSGLLINCCTLEIQADYTRYLNNHLSSTLTVCWHGKPGRHLKDKLCDYMRPKCHPMFYDLNINSEAVVRLNIYQAFVLCAMKFHCYVCELSDVCKLRAGSYITMIEASFRYMYTLTKKRMRIMSLGSKLRPILKLNKGEVEWLGLNAYIRVLTRKQSRYRELLALLKSKLLVHKMTGNLSSQLTFAIDDSHSSLLWKIKY